MKKLRAQRVGPPRIVFRVWFYLTIYLSTHIYPLCGPDWPSFILILLYFFPLRARTPGFICLLLFLFLFPVLVLRVPFFFLSRTAAIVPHGNARVRFIARVPYVFMAVVVFLSLSLFLCRPRAALCFFSSFLISFIYLLFGGGVRFYG